jgi:hypothetical protein
MRNICASATRPRQNNASRRPVVAVRCRRRRRCVWRFIAQQPDARQPNGGRANSDSRVRYICSRAPPALAAVQGNLQISKNQPLDKAPPRQRARRSRPFALSRAIRITLAEQRHTPSEKMQSMARNQIKTANTERKRVARAAADSYHRAWAAAATHTNEPKPPFTLIDRFVPSARPLERRPARRPCRG